MFGNCLRLRGEGRRAQTVAAMLFLVLFAAVLPLSPGRASAAEIGSVYVHLHPCPARTVPGLPTDYGTLTSMCNDQAVYFNYALTTEGVTYNGQEVSGSPLERSWDGVPMHIFTIEGQVTPYEGEPVVYCQNGDGGTSNEYQLMVVSPANSWAIHPVMGSSGYVVCDWFAASTDVAEATGSVTMEVHLCPESFDLANADHNVIPSSCPGAQPGIGFEIASNLNPAAGQSTGEVVDLGVYWQYLNADFLQITQTTTDGFGTPRVFCRGVVDGGANFDTAEIPANGGTFAYNLLAGEQLTCDWYMQVIEQDANEQIEVNQPNEPADQSDANQTDEADESDEEFQSVKPDDSNESGDQGDAGPMAVVVNERLCPQGYELKGVDVATLANDCTQTKNNVLFVLIQSDQRAFVQPTGTSDDGAVRWNDVPSGQVLITQPVSGGAPGQHQAYCAASPLGGKDAPIAEKMPIVNGTIIADVKDGDGLTCTWYDVS
jgi:hypothetical protein